jgi:pyrroloquinoline quinone (PQQ) biosynthesis protein C
MVAAPDSIAALNAELDEMTNRQFETPEFHDLLSLPLTMARARLMTINMAHYVRNRRDCWGYVQGAAPLDVKRLIWEHESDELVNDPRAGMDHYALAAKEARVLGLTPEDIETGEPIPGATACYFAWIHVAMTHPWLEAVTASSVLERRNSGAVVRGGGLSQRVRAKMIQELGIPEDQLINQSVHVEADLEHASLLDVVLERYVTTAEAREAILRGARDSFQIDRAYRGALAQAMARLD